MAKNANLHAAKKAKNDEFYTRYEDIQAELIHYQKHFRGKVVYCNCDDPAESNFVKFFLQVFNAWGIKKLVSTCYVSSPIAGETISALDTDPATKRAIPYKLIVTQVEDEELISNDRNSLIKLFQKKGNELTALNGDGDFRSDECAGLLKQADIIVTNPPFSLFREFVAWLMESEKQFIIIGNMNAITYKEVFPLIKNNMIWLGATGFVTDMVFGVPEGTVVKESDKKKAERLGYVGDYTRLGNSCWYTNIDHGRRHQPLQLMTMAENFKYSKHKSIRENKCYEHYDNYDAIEIPYTDAIPNDYTGVMGVPISFMDKYCPEQFSIVGQMANTNVDEYNFGYPFINGARKYARILIRKKQ